LTTARNKVALITGASSGIGRETAILLAARGWSLAITARRKDRLDSLATSLVKKGDECPPLVLPADISQPDQARAVVLSAAAHFGRLDVLVNNAGILRMAPFMDMPVDEMREIFETNFWATIETVRAAVPVMEKQGGGHIVQVGSGVSRRGLPFMTAYAASKFALLGLTEGLRLELAPRRITLSLVLPGGTETEMPANLDRPDCPHVSRTRTLPRVGPSAPPVPLSKPLKRKKRRFLSPGGPALAFGSALFFPLLPTESSVAVTTERSADFFFPPTLNKNSAYFIDLNLS
jgi:NAD(P)-dependent dehydrogenase (short-subunit alcohol dehydrogenase family)